MATIGATGRDYATIGAWEAALGAGVQTGDMYADAAFDESVTINDADPTSILLQAASGEGHAGTDPNDATAAVTIDRGGSTGGTILDSRSTKPTVIEGIIIKNQRGTTSYHNSPTGIYLRNGPHVVRRCIIHDLENSSSSRANSGYGIQTSGTGTAHTICNNIVYDIYLAGTDATRVSGIDQNKAATKVYNNTVYDIRGGAAPAYGIYGGASTIAKNNAVTDTTDADYSGTFDGASTNNLDEDGTAPATNRQTGKSAANQYVTPGSDFHLKAGADCIDNGADLGTGDEIEVDIDGRDRDAEGDTWDIGADQYVAAASALVGSTSITFAASGDLGAVGTLAGSVSLTFAATGDVAAKGALAGDAVLTFAASGDLTAPGALTGTADLVFAASGDLGAAGSLTGSSSITFAASGNVASTGALAGSTSVTFGVSGNLGSTGALAGSTSLAFAASGAVAGVGALAGSSSLIFTATGSLASPGALTGSTGLTFAASAAPSGTGLLSGATGLALAATAGLTAKGAVAGDAALTFGLISSLTGGGALAGSLSITFAVTGNLNAGGVILPVGLLSSGHYSLGV